MLSLVLPKGSLEKATLELFDAADLAVRRGSDRDYRASVDDPRIDRVMFLRPQEIPRYVEQGLFDVGITGRDWIAETEAGALGRVVREQPHRPHAEIDEDLRTDAVIARVGGKPQLGVRFHGVASGFLQPVRLQLVEEADTAAFVSADVDDDAAPLPRDRLHRVL